METSAGGHKKDGCLFNLQSRHMTGNMDGLRLKDTSGIEDLHS